MSDGYIIRPAGGEEDMAVVAEMFREYEKAIGTDLCFQSFDDELANLPGKYAPPGGQLILGEADGKAFGCVGFWPLTDDVAEMKRLYVRPEARGTGLGRTLAETVILFAGLAGYQRLCLDTLPTMAAAQALYRDLGFVTCDPYYKTPIAGTLFMERALSGLP